MSKFLKITTSLLIFIFAFSLVSAIAFSAQAADEIQFTPQITVGEFQAGATTTVESNTIGKYIESIYTYAISIVGILAALFIIIGGLQWLTSAGNQEKVSEAKARIIASLSGLVLVLCSWLLLSIINPDLVKFRSLDVEHIEPEEEEETGMCCLVKETGDSKWRACENNQTNTSCKMKGSLLRDEMGWDDYSYEMESGECTLDPSGYAYSGCE